MQIVIDVDEEIYEALKNDKWLKTGKTFVAKTLAVAESVANGVVLPKGHGRLIDADALVKKMEEREEKLKDDRSMWETAGVETALDMFAPTIIGTDRSD